MSLWERASKYGIYKFVSELIDSQAYVMLFEKRVLIVDPVDTDEFKRFIIKNEIIEADIFLTHEHFDHIRGVNWLRDILAATVYASKDAAKSIELPNKNLSQYSNVLLSFYYKDFELVSEIIPYFCSADFILEDNQIIHWMTHDILVICTPGHSPGSICLLLDNVFLFSGDTILTIPTITRFPGGSKKDFFNKSLPKLRELKGRKIIVLPGHGKTAHLDYLLEHIEFL